MPLIRITGWEPGFLKVSHTQALREWAGLSLSEAKDATDRVLNGEVVAFVVEQEMEALKALGQLRELRAVAEIHDSMLPNPSSK